jgi:hypothetical protein
MAYCRHENARYEIRPRQQRKTEFRSRSHDAVIHVFDEAGNVIQTHDHAGDFKEW